MNSFKDVTAGRWPELLEALGIPRSHLGNNRPCPLCGGTDRFSIRFDNAGAVYNCRKCGGGNGLKLLALFKKQHAGQIMRQIYEYLDNNPSPIVINGQHQRSVSADYLGAFLLNSKPLEPNSLGHRYLLWRGLSAIPPQALRTHLNCYHTDTRRSMPALLAEVSAPDGSLTAFHRIYLNKRGQAANVSPRKKLTPHTGQLIGGAVRLWPPDRALVVAEGVESAIAAHELTGLPAWSTVSALMMERLVLPDTVRNVIIYADNDASFTGQAAAFNLAKRLVNEKRSVDVIIPNTTGNDPLDELNAKNGFGP